MNNNLPLIGLHRCANYVPKTGFLAPRNRDNKGADQLAHSQSLISAFGVRLLESTCICTKLQQAKFRFLARLCSRISTDTCTLLRCFLKKKYIYIYKFKFNFMLYISLFSKQCVACHLRGSFFMFVESGCISTNIELTVP